MHPKRDCYHRRSMFRWGIRVLGWAILAGLPVCAAAQLATSDHLGDPGFWPTRPAQSRTEYAGDSSCGSCHASIAASSQQTQMAHALMPASASEALQTHPNLSFQYQGDRYQIQTKDGTVSYSVSDGGHTLQAQLLWAFGVGRVGQTYLYQRSGQFFEARASYFPGLQGLGFTPGRDLGGTVRLDEAMERPVGMPEVVRCFSCHATEAMIGSTFNEANLVPGVHCEACHGPGVRHAAAMQRLLAGKTSSEKTYIFNPATLAPDDSIDFCGACHATWWDAKLSGTHGPASTRAPAYRLESSQCWIRTHDARLTCITCHDPHVPLQTNPQAYDVQCLRCHAITAAAKPTTQRPGHACPVSTSRCTTCHMPKVYVPEMHSDFTDHRIRIVKTGEPFPE